MNFKKIIFIVSFLTIFSLFFGFNLPSARAITAEEIKAIINQLQKQISQLQQQLAEIEGRPEVWCHDFKVNLKIDMGGVEVRAFQTALQKEGFYKREISGHFDEYTASAAVGFQEKYKEEVLKPWGLEYGTGYVGNTTRVKLNEIYGCGVIPPVVPYLKPYIKVLSPNGGEEWQMGGIYPIKWESKKIDKIDIFWIEESLGIEESLECGRVENISADIGRYDYELRPVVCDPGDRFKIKIVRSDGKISDESNNYFSVIEKAIPPEIEKAIPSELESILDVSGLGKVEADLSTKELVFTASHPGRVAMEYSILSGNDYIQSEAGGWGRPEFSSAIKRENLPHYRTFIVTINRYNKIGSAICRENDGQLGCIEIGGKVSPEIEKSITVISPNGGESWKQASTHNITWTSTDSISQVGITILKNHQNYSDSSGAYMETIVTENDGTYSWPVNIEPLNDAYTVKIEDVDDHSIYDESDDYFDVIAEGIEIQEEEYSKKYAIIASGFSGDELHSGWYYGATSRMYKTLRDIYLFEEENIFYLFEDPNQDRNIIDYKSTVSNFKNVFNDLKNKISEKDILFIYLVGHGNFTGKHSLYALVDGNIYDYELSALLKEFKAKKIIIILTPCNSGGFIDDLSGENRIVITSTEPTEKNAADFAGYVINALGNKEDRNGDGKTQMSEVFEYATEQVGKWYEQKNIQVVAEHPLLDDNADGIGHRAPLPNNGDGQLAAQTIIE